MNKALYNFLIVSASISLPFATGFCLVVGGILNLHYSVEVAAVNTGLNVILGSVLKIKSKNLKEDFDGDLVVTGDDEDTGIPNLQLIIKRDPRDLVKKSVIRLKSIDDRQLRG